MGLNDGAGTKVAQRRNVHEHPDADEDEVADFLQAHLARLDREREAPVRAPTPGDDPSTDGDESDDHDSDDDHDPVTRTDLVRAVHLAFELAFEGMGDLVHPKKAEVTLNDLNPATLPYRARFNLIVHSKAPAFAHYGADRIAVSVPEFAMGNRDAEEGIGTRRGSYPTTIELAPLHTSGELFNGSDRNITHPMMAEARDSIKRFYVMSRPFHYGRTPGDLMIDIEDRLKIFDWVRKFVAYAPPPPRPNPPPPLQAAKEPPKGASTTTSASAPIVDDASRCEVCNERTTSRCGACKIAHFCSRECQLAGHERGHSASCAFHKQILQIGLTPSGSLDNRVHAKTLPSFRGTTALEVHNGISKAILNAAFDPLTEYSTRAVATAQVAQSDAFIAAAMGLCGTGGESQGQGEPLMRECLRLALKLSSAQLRYKNKAGKPGAAHAIAVMKPVRLDRLDHTGERRSVRALLIEIIKFTGADPPDAALLYAKRTPAIPTEVERVALELEHGSTGENEAPVLKVVMEPNTKEAKQIEVREDVPMLLTPGLLNAVFGGA